MRKTVQKSIRLSREVFDFIDAFDGSGFNDKFENLILFCMKEQKEIEKKISLKKKSLAEYDKQIIDKQKILQKLNSIEQYLDYALNSVSQK